MNTLTKKQAFITKIKKEPVTNAYQSRKALRTEHNNHIRSRYNYRASGKDKIIPNGMHYSFSLSAITALGDKLTAEQETACNMIEYAYITNETIDHFYIELLNGIINEYTHLLK